MPSTIATHPVVTPLTFGPESQADFGAIVEGIDIENLTGKD